MGDETKRTWNEAFNRFLDCGMDHADAAFRADQWERRQKQMRTYEEGFAAGIEAAARLVEHEDATGVKNAVYFARYLATAIRDDLKPEASHD